MSGNNEGATATANQQEIQAAVGRYGAAVDTLNSFRYSQKHLSGHSGALHDNNIKLINEKNDNLRDAQANTYNAKQYEARTWVITVFIVICICMILVLSIRNMEYIGTNTANIAIGGILVVGGIVMIRNITDISMRDNMDYDSYSWQYNSDNHDPSVYEYNKQQVGKVLGSNLSILGGSKHCADGTCCGVGTRFEGGKCVPLDGELELFTTIEESVDQSIIPTDKRTVDRIMLPLPETNVTPLSVHSDCATCTNH